MKLRSGNNFRIPDPGFRIQTIRRCRPLLGTFVDITAHWNVEHRFDASRAAKTPNWSSALQTAVNAAFAAIEKIQNLLSAHDPASELSLLNREAASRAVRVSRDTFEIVRRADRLARESDGAFDCTVAPTLARWGLLPEHLNRANPGNWRDVVLLRRREVRFLRPLALDLGGIAKGFAVDKAIEVLREHGVTSAVVNAGGDLRAFGEAIEIHLRHPQQPRLFARKIPVCDSALATSSPCFTEKTCHGRRVSHLVNSARANLPITGCLSVSVRAPECWLADALTKIVLNAPRRADHLLTKHQAEAFVLTTE